ncbi:MAG TPA: tryptophan synthase subunit alpha [Candidatus Limnocylindria bacterium]|nr:tryptophan synthase subunit alpha [Candidatus Limnocylindria bacterium]
MTVVTLPAAERIALAFARARAEGRLALVIYLTVGFPERGSTIDLARAALDAGADVLELGVPFSDPLADGATVQRASEIALGNGTTLAACLAAARPIAPDAPVLLMGYTNPFLRHGLERFAAEAADASVAGVIVPDLPAEEAAPFDAALAPRGLVRIDLYAPTTPDERLARLLPSARGFVYCVALTGVTGARAALGDETPALVRRVRAHTPLPIAVGFGISRPEHVAALRGVADGVVVGSAALEAIAAAAPRERSRALGAFVAAMRKAGQR